MSAKKTPSAFDLFRQEVRGIPRLSDAENRALARRIRDAEALNAPLRARNEAIRAENRGIAKHNEIVRFFAECKDAPFLAGLPDIERQARDPIPEIDERQYADHEAITAMVRGNLWLPFSVMRRYQAGRYADDPIDPADLIGAGNEALFLAVLNYDPDDSLEFIPMAYGRVRAAMNAHVAAFRSIVPLPAEVRSEHRRIMEAREALARAHAAPAPAREIAAAAGMPLHAYYRLEAQRSTMASIDELTEDERLPRAEVIGIDAEELDLDPVDPVREAQLAIVRACLDTLAPQPRRVVELHFGLAAEMPQPAMSLWDISLELGMDERIVERLLSTAMTTLRDAAAGRARAEGVACAA